MSFRPSSRQARQNLILTREEASKFQEEIFGQDGTLMKKRIELIQPIQKRIVIRRHCELCRTKRV